MLLFYCDESGTPYKTVAPKSGQLPTIDRLSRNLDESPWYVLVALSIKDVQRQVLNNAIHEIKSKWLKETFDLYSIYEHHPEAELRGNYILARLAHAEGRIATVGDPDYSIWKKASDIALANLTTAIIKTLSDHGAKLYVVAVDQRAVYRRFLRIAWYSPYIALTILWNLACHSCLHFGEQSLFIVDSGGGLGTNYETLEFLRTRDQVKKSFQVPGWWLNFDRFIVEEPLVVDSCRVQLIQAVDLVAYIIGHAIRTNDPKWSWFQKLLDIMAVHGVKGGIGNVGLTFYPPDSRPSEFKIFFS